MGQLNPINFTVNMIIKKDITSPEAFTYIRKQLDMGKTLSSCINAISLEIAKVFALVPEATSEKQLFNFDSGGIYPLEKAAIKEGSIVPIRNDSKQLVIKEVLSHLSSNMNNCSLFEDALGNPSDPWLTSSKIEYVHVNKSEIFYFFDNNNKNEGKIEEAFNASEGYVFLCALSSLDLAERSKFVSQREVPSELLKSFATNLSAFFVKAYDGEGYLMWTAK
jgi:hypothetical protein